MNRKTVLFLSSDQELTAEFLNQSKCFDINVITTSETSSAVDIAKSITPDMIVVEVKDADHDVLLACETILKRESNASFCFVAVASQENADIAHICDSDSAVLINQADSVLPQLLDLVEKKFDVQAQSSVCDPKSAEPSDNERVQKINSLFQSFDEATLDESYETDAPHKPNVLLIDDDATWCNVLSLRLQSQGVDVVSAFEGMTGFRSAIARDTKAIVLDFEMTDVQGDYVLRRLKDNPITRDIPVIVVTGHDNNSIKRTVFNLGAAAFLTKPCSWDSLWDELQKYLEASTLAV